MPKREEITDVISPEGIKKLKVGSVLKFADGTQIKVTRKTKDRIWGEHIELIGIDEGMSHYGHDVDRSEEAIDKHGVAYCNDCQVATREFANEDGEKKFLDRG